MLTTRITAVALVTLAAPVLMAPSCEGSSSEARFDRPTKGTYCLEDVPVSAVVSNLPTSPATPSGLLGLYENKSGKTTILQRVQLAKGDSVVLTATIPWSRLAAHRDERFVLVADVAYMDQSVTNPGSTLTNETYGRAVGGLFARATRSFTVCK